METQGINLLKNRVEKIFGRRIQSSAACQTLCNDIFEISRAKISFNTIRRLFNLMKPGKPSLSTLNVLSNYCGFPSFDNFIIAVQQSAITEHQEEDQILLSYLTLFFKKIEVCKRNDTTFLRIVQQTILHLEQYPAIIDRFQQEIAKTKNGQTFYFEQFVFIDKLNSYYGKGLQYYLNEKKTKKAQLFGHSLLCYQSWLTQNNQEVEKHYKKVIELKIDKLGSAPLMARYFATQLYYNNVIGLNNESILVKIRQFYLSMKGRNESYSCLNCFEVILAEALTLVAQFDEALFYIDEFLEKVKTNICAYIDVALCENICLLKAIVFAHTGKEMNAYEILQDINPYKFCFLSKKYQNILYLSIEQILKNKIEHKEQRQHLIQETGFVRLSSI
jgi:hypothetical protein